MEFRRIGLDGSQTLPLLQRWSRGIGYPMREAARAVESAFRRNPDGSFKYHAPGLNKRPGTVYARVLAPFCLDVDCPRNCPPFMRRGRADFRDEGFSRFVQLRAPTFPSQRFLAAGETYRAICRREQQIEWTPGEPFHVTHEQLANLSGGNRRSVARHLAVLGQVGLITYVPGSGKKATGVRLLWVESSRSRVPPYPQTRQGASCTLIARDGTPEVRQL